MTIAFLSHASEIGGAEQVLLDLLAGIRQIRPHWRLHLVAGANGPLSAQAAALGVSVRRVPLPAKIANLGDAAAGGPAGSSVGRGRLLFRMGLSTVALPSYVSQLNRALRAIGPDVIQTNSLKAHLIACWAAPRKIPVVWHVHDFVSPRPMMAPLLRQHAVRCSMALAISGAIACDLRVVCGPNLKVTLLDNGIDLNQFSPVGWRANLDENAQLPPAPEGIVRLGLVATMARWKGHRVFLRAIAQLPRELQFRAYVIGGPIYQTSGSEENLAALRALANDLGVADRVGFTGFMANAPAVMRALGL